MLKALKQFYSNDAKTVPLRAEEEEKLSPKDERYLKTLKERETAIQSALIAINGKVTVNNREIVRVNENNSDIIRIALEAKTIRDKGLPEFVKSADSTCMQKYEKVVGAITCLEQTREFFNLKAQCDSSTAQAEHSRINNNYKTQIETALYTHRDCKKYLVDVLDAYEAHLKATTGQSARP
jgi:hypothetical protein